MMKLVPFAILASCITVYGATMPCSIHPPKRARASSLPALTKVSQADAERTALASIGAPAGAKVAEGELEVEHGCLVYSFDIRMPGQSGIEEVMVDPGTGKVISHTHESARQEAAEQVKDEAARHR